MPRLVHRSSRVLYYIYYIVNSQAKTRKELQESVIDSLCKTRRHLNSFVKVNIAVKRQF